jgi:hypothetical protein
MGNRSSIDLCRIHQTLCILPADINSETDKKSYIEKLETILKARQDNYGNWKNISETSEIIVMLLDTYDNRVAVSNKLETINILINKGIELLYFQFDTITNSWNKDINTTAKAMYAIGLYNKKFNFSINDFFVDLNKRETKIAYTENIEKIDQLYNNIYQLNKEKQISNKQLMIKDRKIHNITNFTLFLLALSLSLLFVVGLIFIILFINYKDILLKIVTAWADYFIAGFFSLIVLSIGTAIYAYLSKNIKKEIQ